MHGRLAGNARDDGPLPTGWIAVDPSPRAPAEEVLTVSQPSLLPVRIPPVAAALSLLLVLAVAGIVESSGAPAPPKPPHELQGREDCLACHGAGKSASAVPANHAGYDPKTCSSCHEAAPPAPAPAPASATDGNSACISCHKNQALTMRLAGGDTLALYLDEAAYSRSVHGRRLACTDCHTTISGYPHARVPYADRRAFSIAYYESCKRCHFSNYTKTLDSVHFTALGSGEHTAPVCTDCHGAHEVAKPAEPRSTISQACGKCHTQVFADYADSVHGKALQDDNPDVPVCTTCHGVHSIAGANSASFRLASTALCARCHENKELMSKYDLSANVLQTYLEDFHGRTVGFRQQQSATSDPSEPLCVDCHGIHDIKSTKESGSPVIKANLQATCQKCHSDASPNFPAAWLGHYEPSGQKAPLVYYIRLYYWVLIPMMIGGLVMHIGIDLWRLARNR